MKNPKAASLEKLQKHGDPEGYTALERLGKEEVQQDEVLRKYLCYKEGQ